MIDFKNLSRQELARNGLLFESSEEAEMFIDIIQEEVEVRIGEAISKQATSRQLKEFDCITDPAEAKRWLEKNCPDYRSIVSKKSLEFGIEIMECRHRIKGIHLDEHIIETQLSNAMDDWQHLNDADHLAEPSEGIEEELMYEDLIDEEYYGDDPGFYDENGPYVDDENYNEILKKNGMDDVEE